MNALIHTERKARTHTRNDSPTHTDVFKTSKQLEHLSQPLNSVIQKLTDTDSNTHIHIHIFIFSQLHYPYGVLEYQ
jgi:hypothetical protein